MGNELIEELNEVVNETITEAEREARGRLMSELTEMVQDHPARTELNARRIDINGVKPCGCKAKFPCKCIQPSPWKPRPRPEGKWIETQTPHGQIHALYDLHALTDRQFWELFCERNQYPLGYLAGIRAMGMVQEIEMLRKELDLANGVIDELKKEKVELGQLSLHELNEVEKHIKNATVGVKKIVLNSHEGMHGRVR